MYFYSPIKLTASTSDGELHTDIPSVTNCINHASIMYLDETAPRILSRADYCTQRPSRYLCKVQMDWEACWQAKRRIIAFLHTILLHLPISLTLTWQRWGETLTLRWITTPLKYADGSVLSTQTRPDLSTALASMCQGRPVAWLPATSHIWLVGGER